MHTSTVAADNMATNSSSHMSLVELRPWVGLNQRACIDLSLNVFDIPLFISPPLMLHFLLSSRKAASDWSI